MPRNATFAFTSPWQRACVAMVILKSSEQARSQGGGGGGGGRPPPLEARRALFGARSAPKRADETARSAVFREFRGP